MFLETKIWISDYGYDETLHGFEKSARKRGVEQVDRRGPIEEALVGWMRGRPSLGRWPSRTNPRRPQLRGYEPVDEGEAGARQGGAGHRYEESPWAAG